MGSMLILNVWNPCFAFFNSRVLFIKKNEKIRMYICYYPKSFGCDINGFKHEMSLCQFEYWGSHFKSIFRIEVSFFYGTAAWHKV